MHGRRRSGRNHQREQAERSVLRAIQRVLADAAAHAAVSSGAAYSSGSQPSAASSSANAGRSASTRAASSAISCADAASPRSAPESPACRRGSRSARGDHDGRGHTWTGDGTPGGAHPPSPRHERRGLRRPLTPGTRPCAHGSRRSTRARRQASSRVPRWRRPASTPGGRCVARWPPSSRRTTPRRRTPRPPAAGASASAPRPRGPAARPARGAPAVPTKIPRNSGFSTTTLIRCIAATPCAGGSCASARITKVEKAKNTPPTVAAPRAVSRIRLVSTATTA